MNDDALFSERHGFGADPAKELLRNAAPEQLRLAIVHFALSAGLSPKRVRSMLLDFLFVPPEPDLWTANDNVIKETQRHILSAEWFEVYDFAEVLHRHFEQHDPVSAENFERTINRFFAKQNIGWKLTSGKIESRGSEAFEAVLAQSQRAWSRCR